MYSVFELKDLKVKPRINDISLKVLCGFYEIFLYPFVYNYKVNINNQIRDIELRFDCDNFCHLLGIESIVKYSVPFKDIHNYKGIDGWENVKNGTIDIKHLKDLNTKKFKSVKAKYVYFYLLPGLIDAPFGVKYEKENVTPSTQIDCEILFYSKVENDKSIIHLGIEKRTEEQYYIPRTFFVEKVESKEDDIYISNQEQIDVTVKYRTILQDTNLF